MTPFFAIFITNLDLLIDGLFKGLFYPFGNNVTTGGEYDGLDLFVGSFVVAGEEGQGSYASLLFVEDFFI
jgi:hypothetical protein